jgi:hypothetical protein
LFRCDSESTAANNSFGKKFWQNEPPLEANTRRTRFAGIPVPKIQQLNPMLTKAGAQAMLA